MKCPLRGQTIPLSEVWVEGSSGRGSWLKKKEKKEELWINIQASSTFTLVPCSKQPRAREVAREREREKGRRRKRENRVRVDPRRSTKPRFFLSCLRSYPCHPARIVTLSYNCHPRCSRPLGSSLWYLTRGTEHGTCREMRDANDIAALWEFSKLHRHFFAQGRSTIMNRYSSNISRLVSLLMAGGCTGKVDFSVECPSSSKGYLIIYKGGRERIDLHKISTT